MQEGKFRRAGREDREEKEEDSEEKETEGTEARVKVSSAYGMKY
jgi:hypothetical protein